MVNIDKTRVVVEGLLFTAKKICSSRSSYTWILLIHFWWRSRPV